jgi:hypothetical protein
MYLSFILVVLIDSHISIEAKAHRKSISKFNWTQYVQEHYYY